MPTSTEQHHTPAGRPAKDDALEEIRELFARYRRLARHGVIAERVEPPEERLGQSTDSPPGRAGGASEAPAPGAKPLR
jgi:hypothetical protein